MSRMGRPSCPFYEGSRETVRNALTEQAVNAKRYLTTYCWNFSSKGKVLLIRLLFYIKPIRSHYTFFFSLSIWPVLWWKTMTQHFLTEKLPKVKTCPSIRRTAVWLLPAVTWTLGPGRAWTRVGDPLHDTDGKLVGMLGRTPCVSTA